MVYRIVSHQFHTQGNKWKMLRYFYQVNKTALAIWLNSRLQSFTSFSVQFTVYFYRSYLFHFTPHYLHCFFTVAFSFFFTELFHRRAFSPSFFTIFFHRAFHHCFFTVAFLFFSPSLFFFFSPSDGAFSPSLFHFFTDCFFTEIPCGKTLTRRF